MAEAITPGRYARPGFTGILALAVVDVPGEGRLVCYVSGRSFAPGQVRARAIPVWTEWEDHAQETWVRLPDPPAPPAGAAE